jgi:hypothetical protein
MQTLDQLFLQEHTDKASDCHHYSKYYEIFFEHLREDPNVSLLEIGIDSGYSLRAWRKYFTKGRISGIDVRGNYGYLLEEGCTATYIVDQSSENQLYDFRNQHASEYNIIIDDGSHEATDQIKSFEILFQGLKPGGYYVIEDLLTSNDKSRWGKTASIYDRIRQMVGEVSMNGKGSNDCLCSNKVTEAPKYELNYFERNIEWFFMSCGMVIIKKMP